MALMKRNMVIRILNHFLKLQTAYGLGMRKFIISNIGPIGCAPSVLSSKSKGGECVQEVNNYAIGFNAALKPMLNELQSQLPKSVFLYTNAFDVVKAIIDNPVQYGKLRSIRIQILEHDFQDFLISFLINALVFYLS